ncbi:hypothetical protein AVEN_140599-1 [Araneus ventricosus]|uniref:Uncharacterized protein n=1 Tax=Araneus ventricosus TaxID=182803 RepID=A0A4Y2GUD8_ARAVE|nr:hypothetical protein AVEN_140599-1 [Araneus ventricosus]
MMKGRKNNAMSGHHLSLQTSSDDPAGPGSYYALGTSYIPSLRHCHEQINKKIKCQGESVGILKNEITLIKWMVSGPDISRSLRRLPSLDQRMTYGVRIHEHLNIVLKIL